MNAMSAAHKTLPLPAYLKVTNLDNERSVIVRVNDRGPFHEGRIIDLSYAAAKKLGFEKKGTARVHLSAISVDKFKGGAQGSSGAVNEKDRLSNFIQVAALSNRGGADKMVQILNSFNFSYDVFVGESSSDHVFRVRVGPIDELRQAEKLRAYIERKGIGTPLLIRRPVLAKGS